jgi:hypothetical protein
MEKELKKVQHEKARIEGLISSIPGKWLKGKDDQNIWVYESEMARDRKKSQLLELQA